jgi:hypothetical protein
MFGRVRRRPRARRHSGERRAHVVEDPGVLTRAPTRERTQPPLRTPTKTGEEPCILARTVALLKVRPSLDCAEA